MTVNDEFTWREFRTQTCMISKIPYFANCKTTKIPVYMHHTSLYAIEEEEARYQTRLGNTKNRKVKHYSSELVIDTDNQETANRVWDRCNELNISFELWKLNNYKFYLQRDEKDKASDIMCYQDRQFIRDNFFDCNVNNGLDLGIYSSPFHLCRAKGAIHEVTKNKSIKIESIDGDCISTNDIEIKIYEKTNVIPFDVNKSDWEQLQVYISLSTGNEVNKHTGIWKLSNYLLKLCSYDTAKELILIYSKYMDYCEEKALRAFHQVFGGH